MNKKDSNRFLVSASKMRALRCELSLSPQEIYFNVKRMICVEHQVIIITAASGVDCFDWLNGHEVEFDKWMGEGRVVAQLFGRRNGKSAKNPGEVFDFMFGTPDKKFLHSGLDNANGSEWVTVGNGSVEGMLEQLPNDEVRDFYRRRISALTKFGKMPGISETETTWHPGEFATEESFFTDAILTQYHLTQDNVNELVGIPRSEAVLRMRKMGFSPDEIRVFLSRSDHPYLTQHHACDVVGNDLFESWPA